MSPDDEARERAAFEAFIGGPPFELDVRRYPDDATRYAWPGSYRESGVDLAWHTWCERALAPPIATRDEPEGERACVSDPPVRAGWYGFRVNESAAFARCWWDGGAWHMLRPDASHIDTRLVFGERSQWRRAA